MKKIVEKFYEENVGRSIESYENSHGKRFDFLIDDLKLNEIRNSSILDIGCGYGPIYNRLSKDNGNKYVGIDGASVQNPFEYHQADLDYDNFADKFDGHFDYIFSFETFEHLANPYHCLLQIKQLMHKNSLFYLSIPHARTEHNTIYPGLIYPVENFIMFLKQCAMDVVDIRVHDKAFVQNVFILRSLGWDCSQLLWHKSEEKFRNIPPHEAINL